MRNSPESLSGAGWWRRIPAYFLLLRWRRAWNASLRFRLLALGLMPLLIAFPFVIAVLVTVGGERANSLLESSVRGNLAGARNYLDQLRTEAGIRVAQVVRSERLSHALGPDGDARELSQLLNTAAKGSGLDYLVIATTDGRLIASSAGGDHVGRLPDSYVIRQAKIGVANSAYERFESKQLAAFSPGFPEQARVPYMDPAGKVGSGETRGLLINAAAHFPLAVGREDAILVGGILLNRNFALIEHMREIIFPVGALPDDSEGMTAIYLDDVRVAISRQRQQGQGQVGTEARRDVVQAVLEQGLPWFGRLDRQAGTFMTGYESIVDGEGQRIGMIGVGFPDAPYRRTMLLILGFVAAVLALTMLVISVAFVRAGRELTQRLALVGETMTMVRLGQREARVGQPLREDELGQLTRHFDGLLDTIAEQDEMRRAAQRTIVEEASRRRALFEHERDGVMIVNPDGSVFEANPKCAEMLGYTLDELKTLRASDWDVRYSAAELDRMIGQVGPEGRFFETVHRRKDGSTYEAEISVSCAEWSGRQYVLLLQRDISERKLAEAELAKYRLGLEKIVVQRTKELQERSGQLDAIFALSPDGFVSFNREFRVAFANRAFIAMTGLESCEVIGLDETTLSGLLAQRSVANACFPGIEALRKARCKQDENGGAEERRQLFELALPGNRVLEVGIRLSQTENVSQILYFRDVTHETEVDRMKSEFLSAAAHELRTPMASIYGYSELLLAQDFDEEARREILGTIVSQSELMASIINELLDLARIEARRGKDFVVVRQSLTELVAEALAGYMPPDGRPSPVFTDAGEALLVDADRKKLRQVVLNVVSNAYKYSPDGGQVDVRLIKDSAGRAGIEVRDRGIGMNAEQLARVCERFYRADASGKIPGTGLGMSIVKEIVELHGGSLEIASEPGEGTVVAIWLPLASPVA